MPRRPPLVVALALLAALDMMRPVAAEGLNWDLTTFDATIVVRPDGALEVTEHIVADFSREAHHGIYREIPYRYRRSGTRFNLRLEVLDVTDTNGRSHDYVTSRRDGHLQLRIGRADTLVREPVTYDIRYVVRRGLLALDTHDELYWNVTGTRWPVPIRHVSCTVVLPEAAVERPEAVRTASHVGPWGSRTAGPAADVSPDRRLRFELPEGVDAWSGMTVVVGFPKGHVAAPTRGTRVRWFLGDNAIVLAPLVVLAALLLLWRLRGRDRGRPGSIVVQYEPPDGLTPVEVGTIIDERVDRRDVTATIIDLAVRGHLTIDVDMDGGAKPITADRIRLIRGDKPTADLKVFEREIMDGLFTGDADEVALQSLEAGFYKSFLAVCRQVYDSLHRSGHFIGNFLVRRQAWFGAAMLLSFVLVAVSMVLIVVGVLMPVPTIIAVVLTVPQLFVFARIMPRKTVRGRRALEHIRGLEEYLTRAELPTLELAALRAHFEKLLPYALALNLSEVWARKFDDIYERPPEWFDTHARDGVTAMSVAIGVERSTAAMTHALWVAPRTMGRSGAFDSAGFGSGASGFGGGGGFSGGGGGGGGGSAW